MAGSRYHRTGSRYRTAKQRQALKKAQLASAKKRKRNKRVLVGLASGVAAAGIGVAGVKGGRRLKAKAAAYPYAKMTPALKNEAKIVGAEQKAIRKNIKRLKNRQELVARNKARRQTPEQRAESRKRRRAYHDAYNERRRAAYASERSVTNGVRPRKKRAKETKARKRKTD